MWIPAVVLPVLQLPCLMTHLLLRHRSMALAPQGEMPDSLKNWKVWHLRVEGEGGHCRGRR